jgi:hypothetical protein
MQSMFFVECEPIDNGPHVAQSLKVKIFRRSSPHAEQIGEYTRNHPGLYETFHPFQQDGNWFALYSPDYTATRVMELPSCRDIAGEEPNTHGFCPVDCFVPYENEQIIAAREAGRFGFVAGCIWGDDSSWKIQHLDLSEIQRGRLTRSEKFGYVAMPSKAVRLEECVSFSNYLPPEHFTVDLTVVSLFDVRSGARVGPT